MSGSNPCLALFVTNATYGGGAEKATMAIVESLRKNGLNVSVCALNGNVGLSAEGIKVLNREWKAGFLKTFRNFLEFRVAIRELHPQIIVANCELPELYVAFTRPTKARLICVEHTSKPWAGRRPLGLFVRSLLRIRGAQWVTVAAGPHRIWHGDRSPFHIANPISISIQAASKQTHGMDTIFIGRLRPEKRPEWVISAAIQAGLKVDIFGDGNLKGPLEEKYSNFKSEIKFHGYVTNPWQEVSQNLLIVIPSEYEGDGMVVAEAILRGNPVLLADNPDLRRFGLPEENYFLDRDDLLVKLEAWKESGRKAFQVPDSIVKSLHEARNINTIVQQWEVLLARK